LVDKEWFKKYGLVRLKGIFWKENILICGKRARENEGYFDRK
jgi:hypothetical protein